MKKTVYSLAVDGYAPEITGITFPLIDRYAEKIGAEFAIITDRKYPDMPPVYEKMQLHELSKENDWTIYIDADALVNPEMPDITPLLNKDTVCFHGKDFASIRWRYDKYFWRDGRNIGACNWFAIASDWCSDLWHPLQVPFEEAVQNIFITNEERNTVVIREHLIDDYLLSHNIARYGLKHTTIRELLLKNNVVSEMYLWHDYLIDIDQKVAKMKQVLQQWGVK